MTGQPSIHILTTLRNELAAITATNPALRHPVTHADHDRQTIKDLHRPDSFGDESYCRTCLTASPCPPVLIASGRPLAPCTDCSNSHHDYGHDLWAEPVAHPACAQALQPRPVPDIDTPDDTDLAQGAEWIGRLARTADGDAAELAEHGDQDTPAGRELARLRLQVARLERDKVDEQHRTGLYTQRLNARLDAIREYADHPDTPADIRRHLTALLDATDAADETWRRDPEWVDLATSLVKGRQ